MSNPRGLIFCSSNVKAYTSFLRGSKTARKNDYKGMRLIDDKIYAQIVALLAQDPKVALFQKLLLSQKVEPAENQPDEITAKNEVEK